MNQLESFSKKEYDLISEELAVNYSKLFSMLSQENYHEDDYNVVRNKIDSLSQKIEHFPLKHTKQDFISVSRIFLKKFSKEQRSLVFLGLRKAILFFNASS